MTEETSHIAIFALQGGSRVQMQGLLHRAAENMRAAGLYVLGAVECVSEGMEDDAVRLLNLASGSANALHQNLGAGAAGCSLDQERLVNVCAEVEAAIAARLSEGGSGADTVVVLSKFGREEAEGRGLTGAFHAAVSAELPVLTALSPNAEWAWEGFAEGMAELVPVMDAEGAVGAAEDWWRCALPQGWPGTNREMAKTDAIGG
ncbi:DUF2478 domain-containing protein [Xanthobacter sp. TB0139]|uniref:DUF2478 domain-containing protein n=1 Tax=Xanthobacter sp. TB0139 TaxID=3459178 RepID=UPI004039E712